MCQPGVTYSPTSAFSVAGVPRWGSSGTRAPVKGPGGPPRLVNNVQWSGLKLVRIFYPYNLRRQHPPLLGKLTSFLIILKLNLNKSRVEKI